ncbi:hypothetical protein D1007_05217 [Hordeum vulgare]|nr:hypothetical protein D1007_05217 [Hordeum vulgare]
MSWFHSRDWFIVLSTVDDEVTFRSGHGILCGYEHRRKGEDHRGVEGEEAWEREGNERRGRAGNDDVSQRLVDRRDARRSDCSNGRHMRSEQVLGKSITSWSNNTMRVERVGELDQQVSVAVHRRSRQGRTSDLTQRPRISPTEAGA